MNNNTITCSRCGAEMKSNARYCMKCGNLNVNNSANENMMPYIKNQESTYQVGAGKVVTKEENINEGILPATRTGSKVFCFSFNMILFYLTMIAGTILIYVFCGEINRDAISLWGTFSMIISAIFLMSIANQLVYMKTNRPWWLPFIPIINYFSFYEIACDSWLPGLYLIIANLVAGLIANFGQFGQVLSLIIYIGVLIYSIMISISFARKFSHSPLLFILFPYVILPIIAFDGSSYTFVTYQDRRLTLEKEYRYKRLILLNLILFFVAGLLISLFIQKNSISEIVDKQEKNYYVYAANKIYYEVNYRVSHNQVSCTDVQFSPTDGTYYFYLPDAGKKTFILFDITRDSIEAYVKVVIVNGEAKYYISLTDGVYGIDNVLYDEISVDSVTYLRNINYNSYDKKPLCEFTYGNSNSDT